MRSSAAHSSLAAVATGSETADRFSFVHGVHFTRGEMFVSCLPQRFLVSLWSLDSQCRNRFYSTLSPSLIWKLGVISIELDRLGDTVYPLPTRSTFWRLSISDSGFESHSQRVMEHKRNILIIFHLWFDLFILQMTFTKCMIQVYQT